MEPIFRFKQFEVRHQDSAFKVGTDSCLFSSWINTNGAKSILDIGTGSGLIALMLAQRSAASITAIEKHEASIKEAEFNFSNSPWVRRLRAIHSDFRNWKSTDRFDLIVSNPPYFIDSKKPETVHKLEARHQDESWMTDFFSFASRHLSDNGRIALVLPIEEGDRAIEQALESGFYLSRHAVLSPNPEKAVHRYLMEFSKTETSLEKEEFYVELSRGQYSARANALLKDFLIKL